ncbi:MAG: damage-inducible protein [Flavobacteriaceae bacterium]
MENTDLTFEDYGNENGMRFWWASDFSNMLGYSNLRSFTNPINKAIQSCMSASISFHDDFIRQKRIIDGVEIDDYKLSRFACYMVAMNSDPKKPQVAKAQVYFADQVEKINLILEGRNDLERLQYREEIKTGNTALQSAAKGHGVINFGLFHDAGYRGMYNQGIKGVKAKKGIKASSDHFDFMGRTELAANLFRITLTEERLKKSASNSEKVAMDIHNTVGKQVRKMVKDNTGKNPEDLKTERRLGEVKKELKKATKKLNNKKPDN